jgi:hypothetical protein
MKSGVQQQTFYELKWGNKRKHKGRTATISSKSQQQPSEKLLPAQLQATTSFVTEPTGQTNRNSGTLGSACPERFTVS